MEKLSASILEFTTHSKIWILLLILSAVTTLVVSLDAILYLNFAHNGSLFRDVRIFTSSVQFNLNSKKSDGKSRQSIDLLQ
jgi:hypothetical protein